MQTTSFQEDSSTLQKLEKYAPQIVAIDYTNYKGNRALRRVTPLELYMGQTEHHIEFQWLLKAYDQDKKVIRDFAVQLIHSLQFLQEEPVGTLFVNPNQSKPN